MSVESAVKGHYFMQFSVFFLLSFGLVEGPLCHFKLLLCCITVFFVFQLLQILILIMTLFWVTKFEKDTTLHEFLSLQELNLRETSGHSSQIIQRQ